MAQTAADVRVGVTGAVYAAPYGTALPTGVASSLNVAFAELGYVSEEGVVESQASTTNNIKAWQNGTIVRKVQTEHDLTYALTLLQTSPESLEVFYDSYVGGVVEIDGASPSRRSWVFDVVDDTDQIRIVVPDAQITERQPVPYVNGDAVKYGFTITCYPDANGNKAIVYYVGSGS